MSAQFQVNNPLLHANDVIIGQLLAPGIHLPDNADEILMLLLSTTTDYKLNAPFLCCPRAVWIWRQCALLISRGLIFNSELRYKN